MSRLMAMVERIIAAGGTLSIGLRITWNMRTPTTITPTIETIAASQNGQPHSLRKEYANSVPSITNEPCAMLTTLEVR